jgi:2-dehydropantoate 2-reductase
VTEPYVVVGAGAIGGTLAAHLHRAGHPVHVVDADAEHVDAIRTHGLRLQSPGGDELVAALPADTPASGPDRVGRVLLAVKAQATAAALEWVVPRLRPDGYVVSLQNGLNESTIADAVGAARTVGAFVNLFADVVAPGVIRDGGRGALVVGEADGRPSDRVEGLVADLQAWGPAASTGNVVGYLWSKLAFGAMLTTTALADAPMAELVDRHRGLMHGVAREVLAVAAARGVAPEPFDEWSPAGYAPGRPEADADAATDRLVAWLATMPKDRSGIWRDIAVRHRPVEVHHHYAPVLREARERGVPTPLLSAVLARLAEIEAGRVAMSELHLKELA